MVSDKDLNMELTEIELPPLPESKPGVKTTEFWLTVLAYVLPIAVMAGLLTSEQAEALLGSLNTFLAALAGLLVALGPIASTVMYIYSRTKIKERDVELKATILSLEE